MEVDFNGTWWRATIIHKYRGKYAVKYHDEDGNVEKSVVFERIRSITDWRESTYIISILD